MIIDIHKYGRRIHEYPYVFINTNNLRLRRRFYEKKKLK
jgi:hypothetical protein